MMYIIMLHLYQALYLHTTMFQRIKPIINSKGSTFHLILIVFIETLLGNDGSPSHSVNLLFEN